MSPPDDTRLRRAVEDDLAAVVRLERRCFDDPWPAHLLAAELEPDPRRWCLLAERQGVAEGYLMAWRLSDELHIINLAVDPAVRRRGTATALLERILERFVADGGRLATLEVRRSNTGAIAFYRRHGFREVGVRRGYYQDNGEDALILSLEPDPDA